jgi:hypothetical protein
MAHILRLRYRTAVQWSQGHYALIVLGKDPAGFSIGMVCDF